mmetsp:Transcript_16716/g.24971  ORF Transcript_16716/g.24971 Transcript_16716/m.24971 type:complete len:339 (+) Transcript_16716:60-1076(+)
MSSNEEQNEKKSFDDTQLLPTNVIVHPLVLLSTVDHYNRVNTGRRVVGVLLGVVEDGIIDVRNCYAVPFDEHRRNPNIWFLDHNYHEQMFGMFKKINAREKIVGWYSTGPRLRPCDIDIHEMFKKYCNDPVLVVIDVQSTDSAATSQQDLDIPTKAYVSREEVEKNASGTCANKESKPQFVHIPSEIGALEAEEVGVEHLLRDIKDLSAHSTLSAHISNKILSLKSLLTHLEEAKVYLDNVCAGKLPINHNILSQLQNVFNLMPNLSQQHIVKQFAVKSHDMMLNVYISSLIRSIIALHNLINNKIACKEAEKKYFVEPQKTSDTNTQQQKASSSEST